MTSPDAARAADFDSIRDAEFVLLTTFKRDGSGVPTPVWAMPVENERGAGIRIFTQQRTGKVKRIRNFSRVQVAPCTRRGRVTGATLEGEARLLDAPGTFETLVSLRTKYGWLGRIFARQARKHLDTAIGIEVHPAR